MHWNPYIDLRCEESKSARATCKNCGVGIERGSLRAEATDVLSRKELLHLDCAAKRAPDIARRKIVDKDPEWSAEGLAQLARFVPETVKPAPRSFQRTPILDLSYDKEARGLKGCVFCGVACPGEAGAAFGHAIRAFSIDGERRFHPACILGLAPGLCMRIVQEDSERWPAELKAFFKEKLPEAIKPTPRSPWKDTGGLPSLERSPSARAACRYCQGKIEKGELRLSREKMFGMRRSPVYFHVGCYANSDDFHPRMLELVVLRAPSEITREQIEALFPALPPTQEEDDDVAPLSERLLHLFDAAREKQLAAAEGAAEDGPQLTENVVEIPKGFFNQ